MYWRPYNSFTWTDTGYNAALSAALHVTSANVNAPIDIFVGRYNDNTRYLVVAAQGAGMWRAVPGAADSDPWAWTQVDTSIGSMGTIAQTSPIAVGNSAAYLYCFDRGQGIWRSTNYGKSWILSWRVTVSDGRSGWLAVNPAVNGELWVPTNSGLNKLSGAGSGTVGNGITLTKISSTYFPDGAGGIVFTPAGTPYVVALNGAAQPSAHLLTSSDGGTSWRDAGGNSVGSYASWPGSIAMTAGGLILIASDEDFGVYGIPAV